MQNYLRISRASDLENPKERILYRFFEILPGILIWLTLFLAVFLSWIKPVWIAFFIIAFCVYWLLRVIHFSFHLNSSYKKMKANLKMDWLEKLNQLKNKNWKEVYHLVIFPMYKEQIEVVRPSFQALANCLYPKNKLIIVLAIEEQGGEIGKIVAKEISKEFNDKFFRFLVTIHPDNLAGEIAGKGSNETWAAREAKRKIIDPLGIPYQNIIVSAFDADTQVYPQYFACLTYHYLTSEKPTRSSFQPIPIYNNNIWEAPAFSRVVVTSNTFWQMFQQERLEKIVTYSSHSMSFKALVEMDFWQTNIVSEDAGIFWKSFLFYNGDYWIVPLFYPLSMDACVAKTLWQTIINQYKQQRRWAWGSEGIPYLLFGFCKNRFSGKKKIPFFRGFRYIFLLMEGFWAWATNALIILFLGWLPLILGGENFKTTLLSYNLPSLTGNLMTMALIGLLMGGIISTLLLPPRPAGYSRWKNLFMVVQWALLPFTLIFFGALPAIDAQSRLMAGKYLGFWVTEKVRKTH